MFTEGITFFFWHSKITPSTFQVIAMLFTPTNGQKTNIIKFWRWKKHRPHTPWLAEDRPLRVWVRRVHWIHGGVRVSRSGWTEGGWLGPLGTSPDRGINVYCRSSPLMVEANDGRHRGITSAHPPNMAAVSMNCLSVWRLSLCPVLFVCPPDSFIVVLTSIRLSDSLSFCPFLCYSIICPYFISSLCVRPFLSSSPFLALSFTLHSLQLSLSLLPLRLEKAA